MIIRLSLTFLLFFATCVNAQNLIPNGSFELSLKPVKSKFSGNLEWASPWFPAGLGSPDLIRNGEVPFGHQQAADGNQFAGLILYDEDNPNFREYLEVKLTRALQPGERINLTLKVSASDNSKYFTDALEFVLTKDSLRRDDWFVIPKEPQFSVRKFKSISDTSEAWLSLEMNYEAKGGERFLTIGNFRKDGSTGLQPNKSDAFFKISYLYLDDISLVPSDPEQNITIQPVLQKLPGGEELPASKLHVPNVVTPNGDGFNDIFYIEGLPRYSKLKIYSNSGLLLYSDKNYRNDWDGTGLVAGTYKYELKLPDGNIITGPIDVVKRK